MSSTGHGGPASSAPDPAGPRPDAAAEHGREPPSASSDGRRQKPRSDVAERSEPAVGAADVALRRRLGGGGVVAAIFLLALAALQLSSSAVGLALGAAWVRERSPAEVEATIAALRRDGAHVERTNDDRAASRLDVAMTVESFRRVPWSDLAARPLGRALVVARLARIGLAIALGVWVVVALARRWAPRTPALVLGMLFILVGAGEAVAIARHLRQTVDDVRQQWELAHRGLEQELERNAPLSNLERVRIRGVPGLALVWFLLATAPWQLTFVIAAVTRGQDGRHAALVPEPAA